ncbi:MAG: hypothetical protein GEU77_08755 [Deltaproteobacteria bacterium]|nr:hypothetical protein [Deltaproteobacteria bacterium]
MTLDSIKPALLFTAPLVALQLLNLFLAPQIIDALLLARFCLVLLDLINDIFGRWHSRYGDNNRCENSDYQRRDV